MLGAAGGEELRAAPVTGRANVELIIERNGDQGAFVTRSGGGPVPQARLVITLDGYSAPLTAGNFAANIQDGVYNGKTVNASYASVLAGRGIIPGTALVFYCTACDLPS